MKTYLERYQCGEYQAVWHDLMRFSAISLQEPVYSDVIAVARETMERVLENLNLLAHRLHSLGYQFRNPESVLVMPLSNTNEVISYLEQRVGVLPLSLRAFYEVVGSINFTGRNPNWIGCDYPDPIVVEPIDTVLSELRDWEYDKEGYEKAFGSFRVPIAPDRFLKEDVSGGMWYGIALPSPGVDAILLEEGHETTFVEYLRLCFRWGGFPGLEQARPGHRWPIAELTSGLLEI